jgi:hypothetical protein
MTDKELLSKINEMWDRNYPSLDAIPYKVLLITNISLLFHWLEVNPALPYNKTLDLTRAGKEPK